ncbi:uncharacterized protein BDZ99DRAFT_475899 [Mytilinidion resinicola]|uniref:Uncharacterized protein n=1 Tax=Mytilinidion resinicola TaxID=574789 RepID=A0A6A6YR72_9PEZI|nr:uncharacterized protein BDZ99DRAFT_475899 [Mytilinidion resinicola]KAF2811048.1 hypothetical protein BDZ99DRAFT_475899 [Mytilinidion resinicola]
MSNTLYLTGDTFQFRLEPTLSLGVPASRESVRNQNILAKAAAVDDNNLDAFSEVDPKSAPAPRMERRPKNSSNGTKNAATTFDPVDEPAISLETKYGIRIELDNDATRTLRIRFCSADKESSSTLREDEPSSLSTAEQPGSHSTNEQSSSESQQHAIEESSTTKHDSGSSTQTSPIDE